MSLSPICPRHDVPFISTDVLDSRLVSRPWWIYLQGLGSKVGSFESLFVTPQQFGAVGNGINDDTAAFKEAAAQDGKSVFLPNANYVISDTINPNLNQRWIGASRDGAVITMSDPSKYAFKYLSALQAAPYDINSGFVFESFTVNAKYGFQFNRETTPTPPDYQGFILSIIFNNMNIQGTYATATDPDRFTDIEPTWAQMLAFGVGISASQCFGLVVAEYSQIQNCGIGVYLRNSDECVIRDSRVTLNGHQIGVHGTLAIAFGNTNKILNNALGGNRRVGVIRNEQALGTTIKNNYFESQNEACRILWSYNSIATIFVNNRVDNPNFDGSITTPIMKLDDWHSDLIMENVLLPNGFAVPPMEFLYTYWAGTFNLNQYLVMDNGTHWPTPGQADPGTGVVYPPAGGVLTSPVSPLIFNAFNIPNNILAGALSFPFEINATTGRWMTIKQASPSVLGIRFPLQNQLCRRFVMEFTARNAIAGAVGSGGVFITYEGAGSTTLVNTSLEFLSTTKVDQRQVSLTIPVGEVTNGYFLVEIDTEKAEWEDVQLSAIPTPTGIIEGYDVVTSSVSTATDDPTQPNFPLYELVDVSRDQGDEVGAFQVTVKGATTKRLCIGFDAAIGASGGFWLQALNSGVSTLPIVLNPAVGGRTQIGSVQFIHENGSPEGAVTANPGDITLDYATPAVWLKATGSGNTGWQKLTTANSLLAGLTANRPLKTDATSTALVAAKIDLTQTNDVVAGIAAGLVKSTGATGVLAAAGASDLPSGIDATKLGAGTVDNTELGYLDGVSSAIQTQLNAKAPSSGINATAISGGSVDNAEFDTLNGVTSGIQSQLNGLQSQIDDLVDYDTLLSVALTAAESDIDDLEVLKADRGDQTSTDSGHSHTQQ